MPVAPLFSSTPLTGNPAPAQLGIYVLVLSFLLQAEAANMLISSAAELLNEAERLAAEEAAKPAEQKEAEKVSKGHQTIGQGQLEGRGLFVCVHVVWGWLPRRRPSLGGVGSLVVFGRHAIWRWLLRRPPSLLSRRRLRR